MEVEFRGKKITENYLFKKEELKEFLGVEGSEAEDIYQEIPKVWLSKRSTRVRLGTLVDWMHDNNYECLLKQLGLLGESAGWCAERDDAIQEYLRCYNCNCPREILKNCVYRKEFCNTKEKINEMCSKCDYETLEFARDPLVSKFSPRLLNPFWRRAGWKTSTRIKGFVYFITDGEYVKIGKAGNVSSRLSGLQCGNPRELSVLFTVPVGRDDYLLNDTEHFLHLVFKRYRKCGEWFDILNVIDAEEWKKYYGSILRLGATSSKEYAEIVKRRVYG